MRFVYLVITLIGAAVIANAQPAQTLTEITGTAIDQAGAVIPAVKVVLSNAKGKKYEALTNENGAFRLKVPAGTYLIEAEYTLHKAWEPFLIEKYEVAAAKRMTFDICLRVDEKFTEIHGTPVPSEKKRKP